MKVPGEDEFLAECAWRIRYHARRVSRDTRDSLALEVSDVEQMMREHLVSEIRRKGRLLDAALVTTILKRRVMHYERKGRLPARRVDVQHRKKWDQDGDDRSPVDLIESPFPTPDGDEDAEVAAAVVYALRKRMPPAAFAVLHLRLVEELSAAELREITGKTPRQSTRQVWQAKQIARDALAALGIETLADVEEYDGSR